MLLKSLLLLSVLGMPVDKDSENGISIIVMQEIDENSSDTLCVDLIDTDEQETKISCEDPEYKAFTEEQSELC